MKIDLLVTVLVFGIIAQVSAQKSSTRAQGADVKSVEQTSSNKPEASVERKETFDHFLDWRGIITEQTLDERTTKRLGFRDARIQKTTDLPYFAKTIALREGMGSVHVSLGKYKVVDLTDAETKLAQNRGLEDQFEVSSFVRSSRGKKYAVIMVMPLRKQGSKIERLESFNLKIEEHPISSSASRGSRTSHEWKSESVLNTGEWYKLSTGADGIYKVDYSWLQEIGAANASFSSDQLRLYGTGAGALPAANDQPRPDDLLQIPIQVEDGGDGDFGPGDYFLFYGEDQITWSLDENRFYHNLNPYSDSTFYFLTTSGDGGEVKRVQVNTINQSSNYSTSTYDYYNVHEEELTNLIKSGRTWYGEQLGTVTSRDFGFNVPNVVRSEDYWFRVHYAAKSTGISGVGMRFSMLNQSGVSQSSNVSPVASYYGALFADDGVLTLAGKPTVGNELIAKVELQKGPNPNAQAWVDYIEMNARRQLVFLDGKMNFRDKESIGSGRVTEFTIRSTEAVSVWDVTNVSDIKSCKLTGGVVGGYKFKSPTETLREFIAFSESGFLTPSFVGPVTNQNLHGLAGIEYVIVSHPLFKTQATRLAELHQSIDGMTSVVVTPEQIYNEFSGGAQDITAIKEFMRMLYFEADSSGGIKPRYLLAFGDASYDYKDLSKGNSNFVPTHQMKNSLSPVGSIASDDYFGLLDDDEGESPGDFIDIGIGRLPARSRKEAEDMVNKIVRYADRASSFGEWRNRVAFVADDADPGDGHTFMKDFEGLGDLIDTRSPAYLVQKLYMDSYNQQVGSGGERYPLGAEAISERVRKGALMMYYIGHGGELGWSHERILEVPTINKWDNIDNLPLFITATCEFARFDDPRRTSGGEYVLLNPSGGGIALLTTTRAVYASPNLTLTTAFTTEAFDESKDDAPRLGELMLQTKIRTLDTNSSAALNSRSFALLGDPALRLAYPEKNAIITASPDTIRALEKVKITGMVTDENGSQLESFNGFVYPSVYDKASTFQTLNNDGVGPFEYKEWKNLIFKGKATVKNGKFSFEFVIPKDIDRRMGIGRINLYAEDGKIDANGDYRDFAVGGLSDNPINDDVGPEIGLFMNNDEFVFGGLTNESPDLYAELRDENGINMVGSGIGHDLTAILDKNTSNTIVLNDYYEADVDSYQSGKVLYPFSDLEEGKHSLSMKVWDVNNNPSDSYLEFIVANDEQLALEHVLNYPNPFTTNTDFYFEHNKPGQNLDVRIEVFTVAGKLVKTLDGDYLSNSFRVGPINWNGRDQYGDVLAKGVYLYRVSVKTPIGESVEKFERLVLLK